MQNFNVLSINKYNRIKAVTYALEFALKRNSIFHDFSNEGGNCTNYVSQCIFAGAPIMNYSKNAWFYSSAYNTSLSWISVEPLGNFLTTNKGVGPFGTEGTFNTCEIGDIIQLKFKNKFQFSHSMIISKIQERTPKGIFVCANSKDVKQAPLSTYSYENVKIIHILGYREPK